MTDIRPLTADFAVAPQLRREDMAEAAARGFLRVVNNRPDGEESGQPASADLREAAEAAGLDYREIPVGAGGIGAAEVEAMVGALSDSGDRTLAFCRSGTRSSHLWAYAAARLGRDPAEIIAAGAAAGYDLSPLAHTLAAIARATANPAR